MIQIKNLPNFAANASQPIGGRFTFVRCLNGNYSMKIEGFYQGEKLIDFDGFSAGLDFTIPTGNGNAPYMDQVIVTNGATLQTIVLAMGDGGDVTDNRLIGSVNITGGLLSKSLGEDTSDGYNTVTVANGSATLIKAATSQGGRVIIQNRGAVEMAIGWDNTLTYAKGLVLLPTTSVEVSAGISVYGIGNGATVDCRYMSGKYA